MPVTTLSESSSDGVGASSNSASGWSVETGTLTDTTMSFSEPSTLTATGGGYMTVGVSDIVSGGSSNSSLYETSNDSGPDVETGTLTTTVVSSDNLNNSTSGNQGNLSTTSTLTDSSSTTFGDFSTETLASAITVGSGAVISSGGASTSFWANGSDHYSLFETGQETYSSSVSLTEGGASGNNETNSYSGSGSSTLTTTATDSYTSTLTATTTLGTNGIISSGGSTDSLYETGNDSIVSDAGSGTRIRQVNYGGTNGQSSTFTTSYSSLDSGNDSYTETVSETQSLGTNGTIAAGLDLNTLTSFGSSTYTYSESGGRTIWFAEGGYIGGSYSDTETTSQSYSLSDYSSIVLGTNGTISGGVAVSYSTQTYSDSQSYMEYGAENIPDPESGPTFSGGMTLDSVTTSYAASSNQGTDVLGTLGAITGGGNSFTFVQNNYNSLWLNGADVETDTASYSMSMSGVETYGTGGTISGGSDNFTWTQNASDQLSMMEWQSAGTGSQVNYEMIVSDTVSDSMYDIGSDSLGASDSILSNGDTYTIVDWRVVNSTVDYSGSSTSPCYLSAIGSDTFTMTDVGTSTLQPSGQTYGTDTINYIEYSTETDYDSVTSGDNYEWGNASEVYTDSDTCTVFNSNGVITSDDLFTLYVSHDVFGGDEGSTANSTMSESWVDNANDSDVTSDNGTSSPSGLAITFTNTDISNDVGMSNETVYGSNGYTAGGGNANTATNYTSGYYDSSGEGSNYSTLSSYSCTNNQWNTGNVWISGIGHPFTIGDANERNHRLHRQRTFGSHHNPDVDRCQFQQQHVRSRRLLRRHPAHWNRDYLGFRRRRKGRQLRDWRHPQRQPKPRLRRHARTGLGPGWPGCQRTPVHGLRRATDWRERHHRHQRLRWQ